MESDHGKGSERDQIRGEWIERGYEGKKEIKTDPQIFDLSN